MKPFLCLNCIDPMGGRGKHFWSDVPVCACGVDGRLPEYADYVRPLCVLHYEPPHAVLDGKGTGLRLCDGVATRTHNPNKDVATGSPAAVTCPACRSHKDFPGNVQVGPVPETADFPV